LQPSGDVADTIQLAVSITLPNVATLAVRLLALRAAHDWWLGRGPRLLRMWQLSTKSILQQAGQDPSAWEIDRFSRIEPRYDVYTMRLVILCAQSPTPSFNS